MESKNLQSELSVGEILSQTFNLYSRNFVQYLIPFLAAGILTGLVTIAVRSTIIIPAAPVHSHIATAIGMVSNLPNSNRNVSIFIRNRQLDRQQHHCRNHDKVYFRYTGERTSKPARHPSISQCQSYFPLLAASIITGILIVLGFIALVVPGVILALMFSLVYPALMLEGTGVLGSLSRSRELVSNRWLKTFGLLLLLGIIVAILNGVFVLIASPFGVVSPLISGILTALITPIFAIAITLYYYSMKARTLPLPPPPPPAQTF